VPNVNGFNVVYNSVDKNIRDIYSVITRDKDGQDQVSLRFADGNFGNVPTGLLRVWYRVSNGLTYQIRPSDMTNLKFNFLYNDNLNNSYSVAFNTNLQYTVANAQATQTNQQIALNAEQVYYTQDRMVNGEDYNLFPLQSSQALKVKAINRTYSGQSRFIDINDPTGAYQNINVFAEDGILFEDDSVNAKDITINVGTPNKALVIDYIQPLTDGGTGDYDAIAVELQNFYYAKFPRFAPTAGFTANVDTVGSGSSTVHFTINGVTAAVGPNGAPGSGQGYITAGSLIKMTNIASNITAWTSVVSVVGNGTGVNDTGRTASGLGTTTIATPETSNAIVHSVCAAFNTTFTNDEINAISGAMDSKQTFGIGYAQQSRTWYVISNSDLSTDPVFSLNHAQDTSNTNKDASWLIRIVYNTNSWIAQARSKRYTFESVVETRFYWSNESKVIDQITGKPVNDYVSVLGVNSAPLPPSPPPPLGVDYLWQVYGQETYPDGYANPASVLVTFWSTHQVGLPNDPDQFNDIVNPDVTPPTKYVFWVRVASSEGYQYWQPIDIPNTRIYATRSSVPSPPAGNWIENEIAYIIDGSVFLQYQFGVLVDVTIDYRVRIGRSELKYLWRHYATYEQRINPAVQNIIDMYVLTSTYNADLRNWISIQGNAATKPQPPTSEELLSIFAYFEQYKMMTDQLVWHLDVAL